jgi:hypothetical protein
MVNVALYDNIKVSQQQQQLQSHSSFATRGGSERTLEEAGMDSKDILLCEHTLDLGEFVVEIENGSFGLKELIFVHNDT